MRKEDITNSKLYIAMNNTLIIAIIAIILFGGAFYFMARDGELMEDEALGTDEANMAENEGGNTSVPGGNIIPGPGSGADTNAIVLAETETGNFARIDVVRLTEPGFVVIYKVNNNGETDIIGNSNFLMPGTYSGVDVQLDVVVAKEETIVAVLHGDDGDRSFESPEVDQYLDNPGVAIVSDVEVVDTPREDESAVLQSQVEAYLESNLEATTTPTTN
jgi:hypothetical protein